MELTRSDHPFIETLNVGDVFDGYYVLRTLQLGTTRANKPFLVFDFTDKTGHIKGKMWDDAELAYRSLKENSIVKVRSVVEEYQGQAELKIIRIRPADDDAGDMSRFMPDSGREPEQDWEVIREAVFRMSHPGLKRLLDTLLDDDNFVEAYQKAPAGKKWHHGYLGGLLEHSSSMLSLIEKICDHYPYLDKNILIAGAVLHDVGKLTELNYDLSIDYTVKGRLLGHIVLGSQYIQKISEDIDELDEETLTHLIHLILSHQGHRENGCPIEPMTREAFILYYVDEIDSKLNAINRELEKAGGGGGHFTEHIRLLNRMLYKGGGFEEENSQSE